MAVLIDTNILFDSDFEDCLQDECAKKAGADYIVTRNIRNFRNATVKAVTPENFLELS